MKRKITPLGFRGDLGNAELVLDAACGRGDACPGERVSRHPHAGSDAFGAEKEKESARSGDQTGSTIASNPEGQNSVRVSKTCEPELDRLTVPLNPPNDWS